MKHVLKLNVVVCIDEEETPEQRMHTKLEISTAVLIVRFKGEPNKHQFEFVNAKERGSKEREINNNM